MTFSRFPELSCGANVIKMYMTVGDLSCEALHTPKHHNTEKLGICPIQSHLVELHPVFSQLSSLLIETLSITQHGEFTIRSKQAKYETIVEFGGHVSRRCYVDLEELKKIQQVYEQILDASIAMRLSRKIP